MLNAYNPKVKTFTDVVKNIMIINGLFFLATIIFNQRFNINLIYILGLFYPTSDHFRSWQLVTHIFMHGGVTHIFFNMFALWMFGTALESVWGPKRFLIYYMVTGLGAALLHIGIQAIGITDISPWPSVGASGAVFGILLGFGMLFPNTEIMLLLFPVPIKAKYFVILYGLAELYLGLSNNPGDNVGHFAHLGGMLFGFLLIRYWNKTNRKTLY